MMNIGLDFDNTIVDYTGVFHQVAVELGWIPAQVPSDKTGVRNYLRQQGKEDLWIELQGLVYGPHIFAAKPFAGIHPFLAGCRQKNLRVFIVSHKTRSPFTGEPHDLHHFAMRWLEQNRFFSGDAGLSREHVFLELTKEAKMSRISGLRCAYFLDDLPEFLEDPQFPSGVKRVLFDPHGRHAANLHYESVSSWDGFMRLLS